MAASESNLLTPGEVIKPEIETGQVPELVSSLFGLEVTLIKKFVSYDDLNFFIKVDSSSRNIHIKAPLSTGYILKITNSLDSKDTALLKGQNSAMLYLSGLGYNCSMPQKNLQGKYLSKISCSGVANQLKGKDHIVRLLTFLPFKILDSITLTDDLCYDVGRYLAKLQDDLKDFSHPAIATRRTIWMLSETPRVRQFMTVINDLEKLRLLNIAFDAWEKKVKPAIDQLPKGYIHGDFNEQNILVDSEILDNSEQPQYKVKGVIDFGDCNVGCYVFDLAILVMAVLTVKAGFPGADESVILGYCSHRPLTDAEWNVLYECLCARLSVSLTMGEYTYTHDTSNLYVISGAQRSWSVLSSLIQEGKRKTTLRWKTALSKLS